MKYGGRAWREEKKGEVLKGGRYKWVHRAGVDFHGEHVNVRMERH